MTNHLYFAYGSNLDMAVRQERRLPSRPLAAGWLRGYRLTFTKASRKWRAAANIEPFSGRDVWGLVFEVNMEQWRTLLRAEGGYEEIGLTVEADTGPLRVRSFQARQDLLTVDAPAAEYVERLIRGLHQNSAPQDYVQRALRASLRVFPDRRDGEENFGIVLPTLDAVVEGLGSEIPGPDCDDRSFERLCHSIVSQQRGGFGSTLDGSWSLVGNDDVPRDVRQDLIVYPTAVALALLATYRRLMHRGLPPIPELDDRIRIGLRFIAATRFSGHGYDRLLDGAKVVHALAQGGVPELLARNPDMCAPLVSQLRSLRQELIELRSSESGSVLWDGLPAEAIDRVLRDLRPLDDA